ncbi:Uncharacterised protein [Klebsiella variicola]|uniref:Cellulose biosynthesis protein BcsO n=1 Tax=Klebsiella variicola TaxID=244366 RepID=A0A7H4M9F6_KLEVA|nr:Uncharacterised protein [Klebsiella variicola]
MNHYDDLQRFQEKTRTQNLKFQDLSSQAATREHGDWAILNQLNPDAGKPASLALGGSVSAPLPQPVPADLFQRVDPVVAAPASPPVAPVPPSYCRDPTAGRRTCNAGTCRSGAGDDVRALGSDAST